MPKEEELKRREQIELLKKDYENYLPQITALIKVYFKKSIKLIE